MRQFLIAGLIGVMALASSQAMAQERRTISISGQGVVSVVPDIARVSFGATASAVNAGDALRSSSAAMQEIMTVLESAGVQKEKIRTISLMLSPHYDDRTRHEMPQIVGYIAENVVSVEISPLDRLGELLDAVSQSGANTFRSISFDISDPSAAILEARKLAVADGKAKAALYATEAGVTLGPLQELRETGGAFPLASDFGPQRMEARSVPISEGSQEISARVDMVFAIE